MRMRAKVEQCVERVGRRANIGLDVLLILCSSVLDEQFIKDGSAGRG